VASYPRCSITSRKEPLQSCLPSRDKVLTVDYVVYPMEAWEPLLSHLGLRYFEFPLESNITICETPSTGICESLSPSSRDFLDVELPLDKAIIEAMITDGRSWEDIHR
jgi:hypothetical protein